MTAIIRDEQPADAPQVRQVLLKAFPTEEEATLVQAVGERGRARGLPFTKNSRRNLTPQAFDSKARGREAHPG